MIKHESYKAKAIFLDRDGTINIDKNYLYRLEEFEFTPSAVEALRMLQDAGYLLIVITNQSGIARGYYTEEQYQILNAYMLEQLEKQEVHITDVLYCPHHPFAPVEKYRVHCKCRKPETGLFHLAQEKWNINFEKSYAIGDKLRDLTICEETACRGFWITSNHKKAGLNSKIQCCKNLYDAAQKIIQQEK